MRSKTYILFAEPAHTALVLPSVPASETEEDVLLRIGWGDNEPAVTAVLHVTRR
ncbi:hypothetical protein ACFVFS_34055 [Kitasatospora sp. NPDC057692]|uniref:hypothetical protein n=1 Tax=Kitasatospora sp. NPDC057692 TaxID=3346215 RepID=UPI0036B7D471